MDAKSFTAGLIGILLAILIFVAIIPTIITAVNGTALPGGALALFQLIPLLLVVAIVVGIVAWALHNR